MNPIVVKTNCIVIEGAHIKQPWVPQDVAICQGRSFIKVSCQDRKLAALCGAKLSSAHPLKGCEFIGLLLALRNSKVTELMNAKAEAADATPALKKARKDQIDVIDPIVEIDVPGFAAEDEQDVPQTTISVMSSSNMNECAWVEATPATLELVVKGIKSTIGQSTRYARKPAGERVTFDNCPNVYKQTRNNSVYATYTTADGQRKTHTISVKHSDIEHVFQQRLEEAAKEVQAFYDMEHHIGETDAERDLREKENTEGDVRASPRGYAIGSNDNENETASPRANANSMSLGCVGTSP